MKKNLLKEYIGEFEGGTSKNPIQLDDNFYQQIPNVLLNDVCKGALQARDVAVYMAFKAHLGSKEYTWPSNIRICKLTDMSKKTLQKCLKRLEGAKHLRRVPNADGGTWRTYLLTVPDGGKVRRLEPFVAVPLPSLPPPEIPPVTVEPAGHELTSEKATFPVVEGADISADDIILDEDLPDPEHIMVNGKSIFDSGEDIL